MASRFEAESGILEIVEKGEVLLRARMTEPAGCRLIAEFFEGFLGDAAKGSLRVVAAPGHAFADARRKPNATTDKYVSLINRASIAALEAAMGTPVDPIRFRANVYFGGVTAWSEHDWINSEISLGGARLRVISSITRCAATQVNPVTAKRDLDIVAALGRAFGHINRGIYAEVVAGGEIAVGDACLRPRGRNEAMGRLAGGSTIVTLAAARCRAMRSCPQPGRTSVGRWSQTGATRRCPQGHRRGRR
jgi:uncharacterized protein